MSLVTSGAATVLARRDFLQRGLAAGSAWAAAIAHGGETRALDPASGDIDAHVHVWSPDIRRWPSLPGRNLEQRLVASFTPEELFQHTRPCGVTRIVLIQMSYYGCDNSYMLEAIQKHPGVFAGVARVKEDESAPEQMRTLARQGVRGFRIAPGKDPPDRWLDAAAMSAMWKCGAEAGLTLCPLINPQYLPALEAMCRTFPQTPVVIDHFARIGADGQIRGPDLDNLCRLARWKNVRVKLSAFYALGKRRAPYLDLGPMIRRLVEVFGPQRLMWASDSPFQVTGGHAYRDSVELIRSRLDFLSAADRRWLLRKTAEQTFFARRTY